MPREGPEREPRTDDNAHEHAQAHDHDSRPGAAQPAESRGGEDARRRGWFWHWNTIITQYAPLIGLKGVGLLNSYTVWTDRREESPLRGYAFPSQQSEADFYGEDRAELITVNKILVALDLIEIRKQMVQRVDERGRRWRVPHNLYRVKDHPDGYCLTPDDVLRVAALAARDRAVYRYVRRVFSSRFNPIDPDNVWHQILPVVRQNPAWQQLARRAQAEEAKASARTRAGHASRAQEQEESREREPKHGQPAGEETEGETEQARRAAGATASQSRQKGDSIERVSTEGPTEAEQTFVAAGNDAPGLAVASGNNGSATVADDCDEGSGPLSPTIAERSNKDRGNSVGQTNRTYHESLTTTTTTTTSDRSDASLVPAAGEGAGGTDVAGPLSEPSPLSLAAAIACFEAANGRDATPLERELLGELARAFDPGARRAGADGPAWVVDAIREAVGSGSRFVAPKRIREILGRWSQAEPKTQSAERQSRQSQPQLQGDQLRPGGARGPRSGSGSESGAGLDGIGGSAGADLVLPNGQPAAEVWSATLRLLGGALERGEHERLFAGSRIVGYRAGTVSVALGSAAAAERLSGEYYDLVSRKLSQALRRPVRLVFDYDPADQSEPQAPGAADREAGPPPAEASVPASPARPAGPASASARGTEPPELPSFTLPGGLSNRQLWAAARDELARRLSPASWESWVRPAVLLAPADDGLVLGAPTAFAQRRLATHLRTDVEAVLSELLGRPVGIEVVVTSDWLRARASEASGTDVARGAD